MNTARRIAISLGSGYYPGLAGVVRACARAAEARGWEAVGIRDGFDGILFPERYPQGGIVTIDQNDADDEGSLLGTGVRHDPFRVQRANTDGFVEEVDASGQVLATLREQGIDSVIALVGGSAVTGSHALSVMWKLARKGLSCVCIPKSSENDLAATARPFGYDSVLQFSTDCLRHARAAARDQGRVAVVEVPGHYAGWLALEAGLAAKADVILIPEIAYQADRVAAHLLAHPASALIVVAKGARCADALPATEHGANRQNIPAPSLALSASMTWAPMKLAADVAQQTYETLQRRTTRELFPMVLDQWVRAGDVTAADRLLGHDYATYAVDALAQGRNQHLIAAGAESFDAIPLSLAVNRIRVVDAHAPYLIRARALGICLGDAP